jgi:hypothetical protein
MTKKEFVYKFTKDASSICWPREMKIVKTLFSIFPNDQFWETLDLGFKLNSLCWFLSDDGRVRLNKEYKKFNFELETQKIFTVENLDSLPKFGYIENTKKRTLKNFLKLW